MPNDSPSTPSRPEAPSRRARDAAGARTTPRRIGKALARTIGVALAVFLTFALALIVLGALEIPLSAGGFRDEIGAAASEALGRRVALEGPLVLVPGVKPKLAIGGIRIANPPGFSLPDFATLGDARLQVDLVPLLRGHVRILGLEAENVRARLEILRDGSPNWVPGSPGPDVSVRTRSRAPSGSETGPGTPTASAARSRVVLEVQHLALRNLALEYLDARTGAPIRTFDLDELVGQGTYGRPVAITLNGRVDKSFPYTGTITGGPAETLWRSGTPWPFEIDLSFIGSAIHAAGSFDAETGATDVVLGLGAENLAEIARFLQIKVPPVGATGLSARVTARDGVVEIAAIRGVMGASTLSGGLRVETADGRARVTGKLDVPQLDLRPFLGLEETTPSEAETPLRFEELERVTLDLRGLSAVDADVQLGVDRVLGLPGELNDARLLVRLDAGKLDAPLAVTVANVPLQGKLSVRADEAPPEFGLTLGAGETPLGGLAELLVGLRGVEGKLGRFDLRLTGSGETLGAVVRALEAQVALGDARLFYGNVQGGRPVRLALSSLEVALPAGRGLEGSARGALLGVPVTMKLKGGELATTLREARTPIELTVRGSGATLAVTGVIARPEKSGGPDLRFRIDAKRAGDLAAWLGVARTASAPIAIAGHVRIESDEWTLDEATAKLGRSQLVVDARRTGIGTSKAFLLASVRSPLIDIPELESLLPPAKEARDDTRAAIDIPILPQSIDLADADIGVGLERVVLGRADLVNAAFAARAREGTVAPSPFVGTLAGVPFQGTLALDLKREVPKLALTLGADRVDVGALLARLKVADGLETTVDALRVEIDGRGARLGDMLRRSSFRAVLDGGTLTLRNPARQVFAKIALKQAVAGAAAGEPVAVKIDGAIDATPVGIGIRTGTLGEFLENRKFVPFKLDSEAAGTRLNAIGKAALPLRAGQGELEITLSGERLDSLNGLARTELPPWGPWSLTGPLRVTATAYEVPSLDLRVGESLLEGRGKVELAGKRPRIDVTVRASRVQLDDFPLENWSAFRDGAARDEKQLTADQIRAKAKQTAAQGEALLSRETLARFDAFVDVQVDQVRSGADKLGSGWLRAQVEEGRLYAGPAQVNLPGGTAMLSAAYTPTERGVEVAFGAYVDRFDYGVLARRAKPGTDAEGVFSLRMDLASRSPSLDAVMAHANGHIDVAVWPKTIKADVFDLWAVNVFVAMLPAVDPSRQSRVNCAVGRFDLKDGKLTHDRIVVDTTRMRVNGEGRVDFDSEQLAFRMQPRAKKAQLFSLQTPVGIAGTLDDFKVGVRGEDVFATVVRFLGSAIVVPFERLTQGSLPADGQDVCADPLREAADLAAKR